MSSVGQNTRVWRKKGEGLQFTAKGSKDLARGRRLHVIVAIAYGKGMVLKETYEKMNGAFFASCHLPRQVLKRTENAYS